MPPRSSINTEGRQLFLAVLHNLGQFTIIEVGWILISGDVVLISSPSSQKDNDKKGGIEIPGVNQKLSSPGARRQLT